MIFTGSSKNLKSVGESDGREKRLQGNYSEEEIFLKNYKSIETESGFR